MAHRGYDSSNMSMADDTQPSGGSTQSPPPLPPLLPPPGDMQAIMGTGMSDGDFRDTVVFLQQQQAQQHAEVMTALQKLNERVDRVGENAAQAAASAATSARPARNESASLRMGVSDPEVLTGARRVVSLGVTEAPGAQDLHAAELDAARTRIADLEAVVDSLRKQLDSKEKQLQRLSEAALRTSMQRVNAPSSSMSGSAASPGRGGNGPLVESRSVVQHADIVDYIMKLGTPATGIDSGSADARQALALHDLRCQQLINSAPYTSSPAQRR